LFFGVLTLPPPLFIEALDVLPLSAYRRCGKFRFRNGFWTFLCAVFSFFLSHLTTCFIFPPSFSTTLFSFAFLLIFLYHYISLQGNEPFSPPSEETSFFPPFLFRFLRVPLSNSPLFQRLSPRFSLSFVDSAIEITFQASVKNLSLGLSSPSFVALLSLLSPLSFSFSFFSVNMSVASSPDWILSLLLYFFPRRTCSKRIFFPWPSSLELTEKPAWPVISL